MDSDIVIPHMASNADDLYLSYLDVLDEEDRDLVEKGATAPDPLRLAYAEARRNRDALLRKANTDRVVLSSAEDAVKNAEQNFRVSLLTRLHDRKRAAICFSGGGIRSATFGLGILQALASCSQQEDGKRPQLLGEFDFISTVSGGGYLGGWLSRWATRMSNNPDAIPNQTADQVTRGGTVRVIEELSKSPDAGFDPEPVQVHHLRAFSNYLAPKTGILSADAWTLASTVMRNMFLNWLVLLPVLAAVLLIPVLAWRLLVIDPSALGPATLWFMVLTGGLLAGLSVAYVGCDLPHAGNTRQPSRTFFLLCLLPLAAAAIQLNIFWAWLPLGTKGAAWWDLVSLGKSGLQWWHFAAFGTVVHGGGMLAGIAYVLLRLQRPPHKTAFVATVAAAATGFIGGMVAFAATGLVSLLASGQILHPTRYTILGFPILMGTFVLSQTLLVGAGSYITDDEDREWWARSGGWLIAVASGWALFALVVLSSVLTLNWANSQLSAAFTAATGITGWVAARAASSPDTGSSNSSAASKKLLSSSWLKEAVARLFLPVFVVLLVMLLSAADVKLESLVGRLPDVVPSLWPRALRSMGDTTAHALWVLAGELAISFLASYFININKFSLHGMYRMRLIRAYLGASNPNRKPNPFTGFDEKDNVPMNKLTTDRPLHVVNIALNLVHGSNLAWQQRKAEPFTSTRLHTGSCRVGYRSSDTYGGKYTNAGNKTPITLGTAITISGAAASPNMGYHSSPLLTLVMTLFNARLGCWLGNPKSSSGVWQLPGPKWGIRAFIDEALGFTDDSNDWLNLSDGGHFENLGIYEMVLRRCHLIVVCDAGADPDYSYEDLANAIRKIRVDVGIPIEFSPPALPMSPKRKVFEPFSGHHCAIGHIRYGVMDKGAEDGILLYIKASLNGNETPDVQHFAATNPTFPQQSTSDQFFNEAQFESYRRLGVHVVEEICGDRFYKADGLTLADFLTAAKSYIAVPVPGGVGAPVLAEAADKPKVNATSGGAS